MATNVTIAVEMGNPNQPTSDVDVVLFDGGLVADGDLNPFGFDGVYFSMFKQTAIYYNIIIKSEGGVAFDIESLIVADTGLIGDLIYVWALDANGSTVGSKVDLYTVNVDVSGPFSSQVLDLNFQGVYGIKLEYLDNSGGTIYFDSAAFAAVSIAPGPDSTAPNLFSSARADDATNIAVDANIVLTFDEDVVVGSGNVTIRNSDNPSDDRVISVTDSQITIVGGVVTINPTANLKAGGNYYIEVDAGAFEDTAGNPFAGIIDADVLNFTVAAAGGTTPDPDPVVPNPGPSIVHTDGNGSAVNSGKAEHFVGQEGRIDSVFFSGERASFTISRNADGTFTVFGKGAPDKLTNIDRLQFDDGVLALDTDGDPGIAFRLYQAAFGRDPDEAGLGFWIGNLDTKNLDLLGVSRQFLHSSEFEALYGSGDIEPGDFIALLYKNILGREDDGDGFSFWHDAVANGATYEWVLAAFSESAENKANTAPLIQDGIWYQA